MANPGLRLVPDPLILLETARMRASPWVQDLCRRAGPVFVDDSKLPNGHFGTYFGVIPLRRGAYDAMGAPTAEHVRDLYFVHELTHAGTFPYGTRKGWIAWREQMIASEIEASLNSECIAYLQVEGLRERTFPHPIWIDFFLDDLRGKTEWEMRRRLYEERARAMYSPRPGDFIEEQIANYQRNNHAWTVIWQEPVGYGPFAQKAAYAVVEAHMGPLRAMLADPARHAEALEVHANWLDRVTPAPATERCEVPFARQAQAFERVYAESGRLYGNYLFAR